MARWNIFILKQNVVSEKLFQLIACFLTGRCQSVILNGQTSDWKTIRAGVSQRSILGPLFFVIYINDPTSNLKSNIKLLAYDSKYTEQWLKKGLQMSQTMGNGF